jgi:hypothetical protein
VRHRSSPHGSWAALAAPVVASFILSASPQASKSASDEERAAQAIAWFEKRSPDQQKKILAAVRKDLDALGDPYLASLRAHAERASGLAKKKDLELKSKASPEGSRALARELPFPIHTEYVFGARVVRHALDADHKPKDAKTRAADEMRALLHGYSLDLDAAFAACLAELNQDQSADDFALFLEGWRNGDESFYRALDRTAGSKEEVFYYDAMLGDFMQKFVKGPGDKPMDVKKNLAAAHDALHDGFLTYRQYRALREAFALSMLLRPGTKLPATLARYETAPAQRFSVRDDVEMLLALSNGDLTLPIQLLTSTSPALPRPLWGAKYEPLEPFFAAFAVKLADVNAAFQSPNAALAKWRERREKLAAQIVEAARKALTDASCPAFKNGGH